MQEAIEQAKEDDIQILIFPALSVCGTGLHNLPGYSDFRIACREANNKITRSTEGLTVIFGTVASSVPGQLQETVIIAENGKENRRIPLNADPAWEMSIAEAAGLRIGIAVQNNNSGPEIGAASGVHGVNHEKTAGPPDFCIYLAAEPFDGEPAAEKIKTIQNKAVEAGCSLIYANQAGGNTPLIHDGTSLFANKDGEIIVRAARFTSARVDAVYEPADRVFRTPDRSPAEPVPSLTGEKFYALAAGVRDYLSKSKAAKKVLIGLSGGIDSALVCVIAAEALGPENVIAVTMPSRFSSPESVTDSRLLAANLGIELLEIPIEPVYNAFTEALKPVFKDRPFNVAEENLQSRTRGDLLMAIANKFGHMVLAPGNKSELAVGYCTLYGDMVGGLAVIGDLFKTEVFEMCTWLNTVYYNREIIPQAVIDKVPSAELRPGQQDTDSLPAYDVLDGILHYYLEHFYSFEEIIRQGFDPVVTRKVLGLVTANEHKRRQAAPVLKLSKSAYIIDYSGPLVQKTNRI